MGPRTCARCHNLKTKCSFASADATVCERCLRLGHDCVSHVRRKRRGAAVTADEPPAPSSDTLQPNPAGATTRVARFLEDSSFLESTSVPRLHPSSAPNPDILLPSVRAYFLFQGRRGILVHRSTFYRSLRNPTLYGAHPPMALLYSIAAEGSGLVNVPGMSFSDKRKAGLRYCEMARDLLLAGYFSRSPTERQITDVEALQSLILIYNHFIPAGKGPQTFPLLQRMVDLAVSTCLDSSSGATWVGSRRRPTNPSEWLLMELKTRAWIGVTVTDVIHAFLVGREPQFPFFRYPLPLPCHEAYFDLEPEEAYCRLYLPTDGAEEPPVSAVCDFSPLLDASISPQLQSQVISAIILPTFQRRAFLSTALLCVAFLRFLGIRMRAHAKLHGIKPLELLSHPPSNDTPAEAMYRRLRCQIDALVTDICDAIPAEIAASFRGGSIGPLLTGWPRNFTEHWHPRVLFAHLAMLASLRLELVSSEGDPRAASPALFSAPEFVRGVETALLISNFLEALLDDDPEMLHCHFMCFSTVVRAGYFFLGALNVVKGSVDSEVCEVLMRSCGVVLRAIKCIGNRHPPMGVAVARQFENAIRAAGVLDHSARTILIYDPSDSRTSSSLSVAFAQTTMCVARLFQPWLL
ncbi:hypothetical protein DFJ74DRAFT_688962 [Hyaloraphidium curvatum]|nr:hypothetical protein DFJ74DRAFT_688962 [Hyaloraphidium curvatum]